ncbi:MAG: hypothetical protein CMI85_03795 [Candidatus Pelagibacter sp.]|nr:hypothetical protein [Candidatus Pelagibacter sp.]
MKLLYQLSKNIFLFIVLILISTKVFSDSKDIWKKSKEIKVNKEDNLKNNKNVSTKIKKNKESKKDLPKTIFDKNKINLGINKVDQSLKIEDEVIFGLYEPNDTKIDINFWAGIDKELYENLLKIYSDKNRKSLINLSQKIFLTKSNISTFEDKGDQHLKFISEWLIMNKKINLIDEVINKNKIINKNPELLNFLVNYYVSQGQINRACAYTDLMTTEVQNKELDKFKIYCLVKNNKTKQAQSQLELIRETFEINNFFLDKIYFLTEISDKKGTPNYDNVFNAHLSILTHDEINIKYENFTKTMELKNYFFNSGIVDKLLVKAMNRNLDDTNENLNNFVIFLEKSANEDLYDYKKILEIYKKYNFSFDQLLNFENAVGNLKRPELHAILYQAILLAQKPEIKLQVIKKFKDQLTLSGLRKIAEPVYYLELDKIYKTKPKLIDRKLYNQIKIFKESTLIKSNKYNNNYIYSSELKKIFYKDIDKKNKKKILKILNSFDKKIKKKQYKLSKKDIAFINLLKLEKVNLPKSMTQSFYEKKIYIPNEIFNSIEKKRNNEALVKTLLYINNLGNDQNNYTRNILAIVKIFDNINLEALKLTFIESEFSL